jgi:Ca2+-binding RTX toxin-like protein
MSARFRGEKGVTLKGICGRAAVLAAIIGAALLVPALAHAGLSSSRNGTVEYDALKGEVNDVTVTYNGTSYLIHDAARAYPGYGCRRVTLTDVACTGADVWQVIVKTGDGDDAVHFEVPVSATAEGGAGADRLYGGSETDYLIGGDGVDLLDGGDGWDYLFGGAGADDLRGGPGIRDVADYNDRTAAVTVTLDGLRNDGGPGENDLVESDVEDVFGGAGNDTIVGDAQSNDIQGVGGDDVIDGGLGPDILYGGDGTDTLTYAARTSPVHVSYTSYCDSGEPNEGDCVGEDLERIVGGSGDDVLSAYSLFQGTATLVGGPGNDILQASGGFATTTLEGGDGDDSLWSANGLADVDTCGAGIDAVTADSLDTVSSDCETLG